MNAVEIKNLSKNFGPKQAVCGLNMTVPMGAIYGFIGENGSGKSTTEKMICGLIPTSFLNIFLYGASVNANLSSGIGSLLICIVVSVAWAVIYNVAGTRLLNKCDVY